MPSFRVETPQRAYDASVERGCLGRISIPGSGKVFVVSTGDVWGLYGKTLQPSLAGRDWQVLNFPGGEPKKRLSEVETLAEQMIDGGGDRSSIVVAFGGGIVGDL